MSKAFDAAWPLKKSDFAIGGRIAGRRSTEDPFGIHYNDDAPVYIYRTPIGKDEDGNLIYSKIGEGGRRVESKDFAFPAQIQRYKSKRLARLDPRMEGIGFDDENYDKILSEVMDDISEKEIIDTLNHEAGHSAHELVDHIPRSSQFWRRNKHPVTQEEMGGEDSFNRKRFEQSLGENIAYTTEYPFDSVKRLQGIFNHPDVKETYEGKMSDAVLDIGDNKNIQQRRNLINAVLDITSQAGRRGLTGNYGHGDMSSASNKLKQARRTSKKIIDRIKKLPDDVLQGGRFTDLPPDVQEQLGRLMLQEQLSLHNELNFERQRNERFDQGDEGRSLIDFMRADPDKFFSEYVPGDPGHNDDYYEWGKYDLRLDPKKARGHLPNYPEGHGTAYWEGLSPEETERLQENFTERDGGWYIKPRVQSNPYTATPKEYSKPRFGTDFVNELIESAYNSRHYNKEYMDNADSSRVFMKAWDLLKGEYLYYNVQVQPKDGEQEQRLTDLEYQLANEGISYDRGWGSQGRDIHLDHSLDGATPDQVLQRIKSIGVPFEIQMTAGDIPYHGTEARSEYDRNERNALDERLTAETGQTHVDGEPYSEPEVIGHHPCPSCDEPDGLLMREGIQHDNKISLNCPECGHMDMDWGENNGRF
jgi:hypothetical protein